MHKYVKEITKTSRDKEITLKGWVHELRDLANIKFVLLRDSTGIIQGAVKKNSDAFDIFNNLTLESAIEITGKVKEAKVKSPEVTVKDCEVEISNLRLLNKAEKLPIQVNTKDVKTGLSKRLDYRSLDIRKKEIKAIFQIQSVLINSFREFFYSRDFIEIQPPGIIGTSTEGGTELFKVKYFEKDVFLAQSPQLYKQLAAISWEKVFSTSPVWRAEKHNTPRHLNEVRQMDIEVAFSDQFKVMKWQEKVLIYMIKQVRKKCKEQLKILDLDLKIPKAVYLSYEETINLLIKKSVNIKFEDDFEPEVEKKLSSLFPNKMIFVHSWPNSLKPFYIWPLTDELSGGFDCIYNGIEISSGGQRIHLPEVLTENLKKNDLNPKSFKWYIDSMKFGSPPHSGWSIGLERLTMAICRLENIREACLFVRDQYRLTP